MEPHIQVLIADDDPHCRKGLRALLACWPSVSVICEATDGHEAVRLVEERRPDVVLMDACMPVLDGLEATRRIKSSWPEVRVVMLTLCASYRAQATAAGTDAFLVKGCPSEELVGTMTGQPEPRNEQGGGLGQETSSNVSQETSSNIPPHPS